MELHTERCAKRAWDHFPLTFASSRLALAPKYVYVLRIAS